ncbi:MAG: hypothetical protein E6Q34_05385 [Burkholderiaceae bacterium]|nr:MAG: hypothetical protein E6Q34_05385 [Burkholderiaceae bacterium]
MKQLLFIDGVGGKAYMRGALVRFFSASGYQVHCFSYSPSQQSLAEIKQELVAVWRGLQEASEIDVIGYSFGGVLLRMVLAETAELRARRAILLASPLKAMRLAKRIRDWRSYRWMAGECGQTAADESVMETIPMPVAPTAAVYGTGPYLGALGFFAGFSFAHDGMVTAEEACALPVSKKIAVSASHGFIPSNKTALVAMREWFGETSA